MRETSPSRRAGLPAGLLAALVAVAGGVLWAFCFSREPLRLAPWAALAPLLLLLGRRRAGGLGFLHGLAFWLASLYWIVPTLVTFGGLPRGLSAVLLSLLAAYLALFQLAFAALGARLWRRGGWAALAGLPALWVALEWLRAALFGGFPWNVAAYAWIDVAGALPLAAWIGAYGISFLVLFANTGLALALRDRRWQPLAAGLLVPLLLLPLAGRASSRRQAVERAARFAAPLGGAGWGEPVRILQPNIPNLPAWDPVAVLRNYRKVLDLSNAACEPGALLVWPESAAWPFSFGKDAQLEADLRALAGRGCTVLFNSAHEVGTYFYNSAFLLAPGGGKAARYDKRHLVPFGEYVPFRGVFPFLDKLARNAGEFRPSTEVRLLPWGRERIGMAICYEVVYPEDVAELTRAGATVLVTITNDAWYGDTSAPWQHLRAARFRAAENRRPMLRAAITGVSALIGADGSERAEIGVFEEGVIRGFVIGHRGLTPYARRPWLPPLACSLFAAFAILSAFRSRP